MQESDVLEMAKSAITASFPEFQNSRVELLDQASTFASSMSVLSGFFAFLSTQVARRS